MDFYIGMIISCFIIGLYAMWGHRDRTLSWMPEVAVVAFFWPLILVNAIICREKKR